MITETTTFSRHIREQNARHKPHTKPNFLWRFRYFIEHSEWDEVILAQEEWLNKMCIGIIIAAALYFIPRVLVMLFLR
jgi:hypothetical protein